MAELWCWNMMLHEPHEWVGTLDGREQTFQCAGVTAVMVSQGAPETDDSRSE